MSDFIQKFKEKLASDYTATVLRGMIVVWATGVILLVLFVPLNKWVLAGILAYEVLP